MRRLSRRIVLISVLVLLAVAAIVGLRFTGTPDVIPQADRKTARAYTRLIDTQPLTTAQQLDKLAVTREEGRYSRDALNFADHAVDLAFTSGLRDAQEHPPAEDANTKTLHERIRQLETQIKADEETVKKLAAANTPESTGQLQLAQAEQSLHQDELEDARRDLMRAGGDPASRIQRQFDQHHASDLHNQQTPATAYYQRPAFEVPKTMLEQAKLWNQLRGRRQQLAEAQQQTSAGAADLTRKHDDLERHLAELRETNASLAEESAGPATVAALRHEAADRKTLSEYDQRSTDMQQLGQAYENWSTVVATQMTACVHGLLRGLLWIVLIVLAVVFGNVAVDSLSRRVASDRRRLATMRLLGHFTVQGLGLVAILFVVLGSPSQLSTVIAFAGAGLTVALKDFIVAFFGWFVLMGKNGIRVGDWVEINGIVGEVTDIGLLRTVLLETGNWAEAGHPTGRRVTFTNSFAIEGHYFNFSTTGQWLWDTLELLVPASEDPYGVTESILEIITKETEADARVAEKEWQHATHNYGVRAFSAAPSINMRPMMTGTNVIVRYITQANERFSTRNRIYAAVVGLLHHRPGTKIVASKETSATP
jgi:small-conductance mechanosensitive channel